VDRTPKLSLDQELQAAVAIVRIGLERLRDAACRTEAVGPHVAALQALYDPAKPDTGVLAAVADVIGTITVSVSEVDHADVDDVAEVLDEAQGCLQDSTGSRIRYALDILTPLIHRCQECGEQKPDVEEMEDPFTTALYPESTDHSIVTLCHDCAVSRFEES